MLAMKTENGVIPKNDLIESEEKIRKWYKSEAQKLITDYQTLPSISAIKDKLLKLVTDELVGVTQVNVYEKFCLLDEIAKSLDESYSNEADDLIRILKYHLQTLINEYKKSNSKIEIDFNLKLYSALYFFQSKQMSEFDLNKLLAFYHQLIPDERFREIINVAQKFLLQVNNSISLNVLLEKSKWLEHRRNNENRYDINWFDFIITGIKFVGLIFGIVALLYFLAPFPLSVSAQEAHKASTAQDLYKDCKLLDAEANNPDIFEVDDGCIRIDGFEENDLFDITKTGTFAHRGSLKSDAIERDVIVSNEFLDNQKEVTKIQFKNKAVAIINFPAVNFCFIKYRQLYDYYSPFKFYQKNTNNRYFVEFGHPIYRSWPPNGFYGQSPCCDDVIVQADKFGRIDLSYLKINNSLKDHLRAEYNAITNVTRFELPDKGSSIIVSGKADLIAKYIMKDPPNTFSRSYGGPVEGGDNDDFFDTAKVASSGGIVDGGYGHNVYNGGRNRKDLYVVTDHETINDFDIFSTDREHYDQLDITHTKVSNLFDIKISGSNNQTILAFPNGEIAMMNASPISFCVPHSIGSMTTNVVQPQYFTTRNGFNLEHYIDCTLLDVKNIIPKYSENQELKFLNPLITSTPHALFEGQIVKVMQSSLDCDREGPLLIVTNEGFYLSVGFSDIGKNCNFTLFALAANTTANQLFYKFIYDKIQVTPFVPDWIFQLLTVFLAASSLLIRSRNTSRDEHQRDFTYFNDHILDPNILHDLVLKNVQNNATDNDFLDNTITKIIDLYLKLKREHVFNNSYRIKSFFFYKADLNRAQRVQVRALEILNNQLKDSKTEPLDTKAYATLIYELAAQLFMEIDANFASYKQLRGCCFLTAEVQDEDPKTQIISLKKFWGHTYPFKMTSSQFDLSVKLYLNEIKWIADALNDSHEDAEINDEHKPGTNVAAI